MSHEKRLSNKIVLCEGCGSVDKSSYYKCDNDHDDFSDEDCDSCKETEELYASRCICKILDCSIEDCDEQFEFLEDKKFCFYHSCLVIKCNEKRESERYCEYHDFKNMHQYKNRYECLRYRCKNCLPIIKTISKKGLNSLKFYYNNKFESLDPFFKFFEKIKSLRPYTEKIDPDAKVISERIKLSDNQKKMLRDTGDCSLTPQQFKIMKKFKGKKESNFPEGWDAFFDPDLLFKYVIGERCPIGYQKDIQEEYR